MYKVTHQASPVTLVFDDGHQEDFLFKSVHLPLILGLPCLLSQHHCRKVGSSRTSRQFMELWKEVGAPRENPWRDRETPHRNALTHFLVWGNSANRCNLCYQPFINHSVGEQVVPQFHHQRAMCWRFCACVQLERFRSLMTQAVWNSAAGELCIHWVISDLRLSFIRAVGACWFSLLFVPLKDAMEIFPLLCIITAAWTGRK